jgi:Ni,Fe-hydrogenase III component G
MEREEVKRRIAEKFGAKVTIAERSPRRVYIYAENEIWTDLARFLFNDLGARYDTGAAVDNRDGVEVMFFFPFDREHYFVTIKTFAAKPNPTLNSIAAYIPGAKWIEREMFEMYEVKFLNHPDLRPADYYAAKREVKDEHETVRQRDDGEARADDVAGRPPKGKNP